MIDEIKDIPGLPQVSVELIRHAFMEEPDIQQVASIVEREPTLTAKLFKTVNSAAFGLKMEVKDIHQAISILGLDALRSTVVSLALGEYFINSATDCALDPRNFCIHSLASAVIMKETARVMEVQNTDQLYLLGLLHDLGIFALDALPNRNYGDVLDLIRKGKEVEEAEIEVFGCNNRQVWEMVASSWQFPSEIIELFSGTVTGRIEVPTRRLTEASSKFADALGYYFIDPKYVKPSDRPDLFTGLKEETVAGFGPLVESQVQVISQVLDLPTPTLSQVNQILLRTTHQLSATSAKYIKAQNDLKFRVEVLEDLTRVYTGIIRSLDGESLAFSVLESLMGGFNVDGAFLLMLDAKGGFSGYSARGAMEGEAGFEQVQLNREQLSPIMNRCIEKNAPLKTFQPMEEAALVRLLGEVSLAWVAPIYVRGRFSSLLGIGVKDVRSRKFGGDDFAKILNIVSGEIGLSLDNTRLFNRVRMEARTDSLTGIFNRRTIMKVLTTEFARFKRAPFPLTVAIFDLDHFKSINDSRGHLAGDEFLVRAARALRDGMRKADYIGRYGGDEFLAVLPETTPEQARAVVDRIRENVLEMCTQFQGPDIVQKLSVSVGLACARENMIRADELISLADTALYRAKEQGRNRCVIYEDEPVGQA